MITSLKMQRRMDRLARETARLDKQETYVSVTPCNSGHVGERVLRNNACCECVKTGVRTIDPAPRPLTWMEKLNRIY